MEFTEQTYTIMQAYRDGTPCQEEVTGYVAEGTGLGYHLDFDEEGREVYMPTHLPSGYSMGPRFFRETDAHAYIEQIAPLAKWQHYSAKDIYEMPPEFINQVRQVQANVCEGDRARVSIRPKSHKKLMKRGKAIAGINHA